MAESEEPGDTRTGGGPDAAEGSGAPDSGDAPRSAPEPDASDSGERPRRGGGRIARFAGRGAVVLLSVVTLALTAAGWAALDHGVSRSKVLRDPSEAPPPDDGADDVLLVGNDSRTDAQGNPLPLSVLRELRTESAEGLNTDTLILMRIPRDGSRPTAVSIPRDIAVPVPDGGTAKINSVYGSAKTSAADRLAGEGVTDSDEVWRESALAAQRALVDSVQRLTGTRIDHYAEVNLLGFYEITRAVGGVQVCLKEATSDKDSGADFPAGEQTISGGDALAFVRQRHGLPRGDLDRIVRQQVFLAALTDRVLSRGTLTDPAAMRELIGAAHRSVVLDEKWDMGAFVQRMRELAGGGVRFETVPIREAAARNERGEYVVTVDRAEVRRFVAGLASAPGFAPDEVVRLDGSAHRQAVTSDNVPCVY